MEGQFEQLELKVHLTASKREQAVLRKDDDIVAFNSYLSKISPFSCLGGLPNQKTLEISTDFDMLAPMYEILCRKITPLLIQEVMLVKHCFGLFHIVSQMVIINCLQQWLSDSANTQQGFSKFSTDMTLYGLGQQWAGNKTVIKVHLTSCNASWPPSMAFGKAIWSLKALTQKCLLC